MTLTSLRASLITQANRCMIPMLARRHRDLATMLGELMTAVGWRAENLRKSIAQKLAEIEQIKRDGAYANPLAHLSSPRNRTTAWRDDDGRS